MKSLFNYLKLHLPLLIGAALIVLNYLIDNGAVTIAPHAASLINVVLTALGLGVLHQRQQVKS